MAADTYDQQNQDWWAMQGAPQIAPETETPPAAASAGNAYGVLAGGFGAPPAAYASNPNAPTFTPQAAYVAPTWQGGDYKTPDKPLALQSAFAAPTQAQLEASPGYQSRLAAGLLAKNRSAAAQGSVLNGGTQKALNRYGQDYASNEYSNLFNQDVTTRGIADSEYGADVGNSRNAFDTNFSVFQTGANNALAARQQTASENQAGFKNQYSSYLDDNARTLNDYLTNYNIQHTADSDMWSRLKDVSSAGLTAANDTRVA